MKYIFFIVVVALTVLAVFASNSQAACTATDFKRDGINLTAALINPKGTVSGDVDATGCIIAIYYGPKAKGRINGATIHDANYFGVVNNGGNVQIYNSAIYDIGETPLNGAQHGVAVYFVFGSASKGVIQGNVIWNYQKGGIAVNGTAANVQISYNTVVGQGPINYIAQNGIQIGYSADADATGNIVIGNSYTGTGLTASGGILVVGGDCYGGPFAVGSHVRDNISVGNDVGVWFSNLDADCLPPAKKPTKNTASQNTIRNNAVNNTSGWGVIGEGYQAGISDQGNGDVITQNSICGIGYTPVITPPPHLFAIDVTATTKPTVKKNTACSDTGLVTNATLNLIGQAAQSTTPSEPTAPSQPVLPSVIE
jgi:hypothetical protein